MNNSDKKKLLQWLWTASNKLGKKKRLENEQNRERVKMWRNKNPQKTAAHRAVFIALRNGSLKKEKCFCGSYNVEAHHIDYMKPLKVKWLCKKHHAEADKQRRMKETF